MSKQPCVLKAHLAESTSFLSSPQKNFYNNMKAVILNLNGYDYSHFKKGDSYHKKIKVGDILDVDKIKNECIYIFVPLVEGGHISYPFTKGKAAIVNL